MPGGGTADREIVEHPGAVAVLGLDESGQVLMIRQYRHPVGRLLWEIPAGLRDKPGESLLATAERELLEETGHRAADWLVLGDFFSSPGTEREYVRQDEEAHLVLAWVPLAAALAGILAGDLHNGVAALGILCAYAAREDGFTALRDAAAPEH